MQFRAGTYTPPAVKYLIIANFICYLISIALPKYFGIDVIGHLGLHYFGAQEFNPVQMLTYMFLHDPTGFSHIFFNMFGLWMFGRAIEETLGTKRFLIFYFVTGVGAAVVQEATWFFTINPIIENMNQYLNTHNTAFILDYYEGLSSYSVVPDTQILSDMDKVLGAPITVGASGALFGLLAAYAILFPQAEIFLLFLPIPIKAPIFVAIYAAAELFLGVSGSGDGVAHYAHIGGLVFGLILLYIWRNDNNGYNLMQRLEIWFSGKWYKIKNALKHKPHIKFKKPQSKASDAEWNQYEAQEKKRKNERIDAILDKIKKSGYSALTEEEKRELFDMSRK